MRRISYFFIVFLAFLLFLPAISGTDYNLSQSLIAYYDFESTAKAVNIFTYLYNGTIAGTGPSSTPGILGNAWTVVGTTRISMPTAPNLGKVFSVNVWFVESSFDTGGLVMGGNAPFVMYWDAGNGAKVYSNTGGAGYAFIDGMENVVNAAFVMWTYTRNQQNFSVYRNNVYKGSATLTANGDYSLTALMGYPDDTSYDLKGKLDDYSVWINKVLSQDDITYLYHGGVGRSLVNYSNISGGGGPPPVTVSLIPFAKNLSFNLKKLSFWQKEYFNVYANHTLSNGTVLSDSVCNTTSGSLNPMIYNTTSKVYKTSAYYDTSVVGNMLLQVFCSNPDLDYSKNVNLTVYIKNRPPIISKGNISNNKGITVLLNFVKVEYAFNNYSWQFKSLSPYSILDKQKVIFYNSTGILQSTTSNPNTVVITPDKMFLVKGLYNVSVFVNDTFKNVTFMSWKFNTSDTYIPVCSPINNLTVVNGSVYNFNLTCTDEYFFSFKVNCTSNLFSFAKSNIGLTSWHFLNSTLISQAMTCKYYYCDGHTTATINDMVITKDLAKSQLTVNGLSLKVNDVLISDITTTKNIDRYNFCYTLTDTKQRYMTFDIPTGCYPASNSKWAGHLICPSKNMWIDFVNPDVKVSIQSNQVAIDLSNFKGNQVCFNSIGNFNCVNATQVFNVIIPPKNSTSVLRTNFCPDTGASVGILAILVFVVLTCLVLALIFKVGVLAFISGIGMFVLAFTVIGCSTTFGVIFMCIGVVFLMLSVMAM